MNAKKRFFTAALICLVGGMSRLVFPMNNSTIDWIWMLYGKEQCPNPFQGEKSCDSCPAPLFEISQGQVTFGYKENLDSLLVTLLFFSAQCPKTYNRFLETNIQFYDAGLGSIRLDYPGNEEELDKYYNVCFAGCVDTLHKIAYTNGGEKTQTHWKTLSELRHENRKRKKQMKAQKKRWKKNRGNEKKSRNFRRRR